MLLRMMRRSPRELSSAVSSLVLACALALACVVATGCSKKDAAADADAASDAAVAVVADAAPAADAAVAVVADAAVAPLATTVAPKVVAKPKFVDPPICAAARSAKQRNSPAAPGLERQCVAAGGVM